MWLSLILAALTLSHIGRGLGQTTQFPDLYEASVIELQAGLDAGHFSSVDLVKVCKDIT